MSGRCVVVKATSHRPCKTGDGFEGVEKVDTGEQFAPFRHRQRLQADATADDQLRHRLHELPQLGQLLRRVSSVVSTAGRRRMVQPSPVSEYAARRAWAASCSRFAARSLRIRAPFTHRWPYLSRRAVRRSALTSLRVRNLQRVEVSADRQPHDFQVLPGVPVVMLVAWLPGGGQASPLCSRSVVVALPA